MRTRLFNGSVNEDGSRDYKSAFIDAGVIGGFAFFSSLAGIGATGLLSNPELGLTAAIIAGGLSFFGSLLISLGIKKPSA